MMTLGTLVVGSALSTPAFAAPNAVSKAAEKRAAATAQAAAAAPQARADEALSFDPFAPGATPPAHAAAPAAPQANASQDDEAANRLAAREAVLARLGSFRPSFLAQIMRVRATKRSPNGPPAFTPRRPSDPPGPPENVPPGPPKHAPPGKPAGTPGNGPGGNGNG